MIFKTQNKSICLSIDLKKPFKIDQIKDLSEFITFSFEIQADNTITHEIIEIENVEDFIKINSLKIWNKNEKSKKLCKVETVKQEKENLDRNREVIRKPDTKEDLVEIIDEDDYEPEFDANFVILNLSEEIFNVL